jgi:hypothetical protein
MSEDNECKLSSHQCYRTRYGEDRCSENPTPEEAGECIKTLDQRQQELEKELADMDRWIESVKSHAAKKPTTPETKH